MADWVTIFTSNVSGSNNFADNRFARWRLATSLFAPETPSAAVKVRVTLRAASDLALVLQNAFIAHPPATGEAWYFDPAAKAQLTFAGLASAVIAADAEITSDAVAFPFDKLRDLVVHIDASSIKHSLQSNITGASRHWKAGDDAGTDQPLGLATNAGVLNAVKKIEILEAADPVTLEEQVAALQTQVAALTTRLAALALDPAAAYQVFSSPVQSPPMPYPPQTQGFVLDKPLIVEDKNVHSSLRFLLAMLRVDQSWRGVMGSGVLQAQGGNPKVWQRGAAMIYANNDTPEVALIKFAVDEQTGQWGVAPVNGEAVGRIYDATVINGEQGPTLTPRTAEIVFKQHYGISLRVSRANGDPVLLRSAEVVRAPALGSGNTSLVLCFNSNGAEAERPVKAVPLSQVTAQQRVLVIDP